MGIFLDTIAGNGEERRGEESRREERRREEFVGNIKVLITILTKKTAPDCDSVIKSFLLPVCGHNSVKDR